ncbi:MAG: hypothetical protein ACE5F8_08875, partial [Woeseiaceae bacterium]
MRPLQVSPKFAAGNKNIKPRKPIALVRAILPVAAGLIATGWPFSIAALEIDSLTITLASVPTSYSITGAQPGAAIILRVGDQERRLTADDDGHAGVPDLVIERAGAATMIVISGDETL